MNKPDLMRLSMILGRVFMRIMGLSWRVFYHRPPLGRSGMIRQRPALFSFWHGRQLPFIHTHRNEEVTVLVSANLDGQYAANVLHSMGFETVRGSSSKGGRKALGLLAGRLRDGYDVAITPDGPRGPMEKAKQGMAHMSRMGKRPVVPMGSSGWPALRFRSWDRFLLPLPFAYVNIVEGRMIPHMSRGDDPAEWILRVEAELRRVTRTADFLSSPSARLLLGLIRKTAFVLTPLIELLLAFRPADERRERKGYVRKVSDRPVWLHGSSLGELNGLLPFIELLKSNGIPVWVTCFTPSGRMFIEERALRGSFINADVPGYAERFLEMIDPRALVIAETEIWPNSIYAALQRSIPCFLVNGRISNGSARGYRIIKPLIGPMMSCFSGIVARSMEDADRFAALGIDRGIISVADDSKLLSDQGDPPDEWRMKLCTESPVLVAGSLRKGEEETILRAAIEACYFPILVPRHLERVSEVLKCCRNLGFDPVMWSDLEKGDLKDDFDSVIVDVHGILGRLYGTGDAAFVGGTLVPVGGHNIIEPIQRGVPVIVGPHHGNFKRIVGALTTSSAAYIASSHEEMASVLKMISNNIPSRGSIRSTIDFSGIGILERFAGMLALSGVPGMKRSTVNEKT